MDNAPKGGGEVNIRLTIGELAFTGRLGDSPTAESVARALPLEFTAQRWGEEYYGSVPVTAELEPGARDVLQPGELAYWPPGSALCLFWGPTPASQGEEIRAAGPVNPIGRIEGDLAPLTDLPGSVTIKLEAI